MADALKRIVLSGLAEPEAKTQLVQAMADGAVAVRVVIAQPDRHVGGAVMEGRRLSVPRRLSVQDFDWQLSRPLSPWETGPSAVESVWALWDWKKRPIELVEVSTGDVTKIWCSAGERMARRQISAAEPTPELPMWFSPMEAIAWIVTRNPRIVAYTDPRKNITRAYFVEDTLPEGGKVCVEQASPPGLTLLSIDLFAAQQGEPGLRSDDAVSALLAALRAGRLIARAIWGATGERKDMGSDEWHGLTLEDIKGNERVLLPFRHIMGLGKQAEKLWQDILFPRQGLLSLWPARGGDGQHAANYSLQPETSPPQEVRLEPTSSKNRGTKPTVALAALHRWYQARRDNWPDEKKYPSADDDMNDARKKFSDREVPRDMIRTVRKELAPAAWTAAGRRKGAQE